MQRFLWTRTQRTAVVLILPSLLALLSYRYFTRPAFIPNTLPDSSPRAGEIASQLDPNTAPWQQLAILPNLGQKKARAIVAYRDQYLADHPGDIPFKTPDDLQAVPGIGPATADTLTPYLTFPTAQPIK